LLTPSILARAKKWSFVHDSENSPLPCNASSVDSTAKDLLGAEELEVPYKRTRYLLWPTRKHLLLYEEAIALEAQVDTLLGTGSFPGSSTAVKREHTTSRTPAFRDSATPSTVDWSAGVRSSVSLSPEKAQSVPPVSLLPALTRSRRAWTVSTIGQRAEQDDMLPVMQADDGEAAEEPRRIRAAREIVEIFERVYEQWKTITEVARELEAAKARQVAGREGLKEDDCLRVQPDERQSRVQDTEAHTLKDDICVKVEEDWSIFAYIGLTRKELLSNPPPPCDSTGLPVASPDPGSSVADDPPATVDSDSTPERTWLNRFHYGHVLTRIICKGAQALHTLKHYADELAILDVLLAQRVFRRGRRGMWHESRALVLMTHMPQTRENWEQAYHCVLDALEDPDLHFGQ
jgi:fanconi-associated nuclease 1